MTLEDLHIATEPTRMKVLFALPSYANEIAHRLGENPKNVAFHLEVLERYGLAESEFKLGNGEGKKPVAIRQFELTKAGQAMRRRISKIEGFDAHSEANK